MTITRNLLRNLLVLLVVLFCAILIIQSIDTVLAINVYIILHLILMSGVLIALIWVDFKEIRKQVREKSQKMDEDFEKERAEKEEKFSRESQAFWLRVAAENEARAAAVAHVPVPVQKTTLVISEEKGSVYGPVPRKSGGPLPNTSRVKRVFGPVPRKPK